jgi:hypothetical protein
MFEQQATEQLITTPILMFFGMLGAILGDYSSGITLDKMTLENKTVVEFVVATPSSYDKAKKTNSFLILTKEKLESEEIKDWSEKNKALITYPLSLEKGSYPLQQMMNRVEGRMEKLGKTELIADKEMAKLYKLFICSKSFKKITIEGENPCDRKKVEVKPLPFKQILEEKFSKKS